MSHGGLLQRFGQGDRLVNPDGSPTTRFQVATEDWVEHIEGAIEDIEALETATAGAALTRTNDTNVTLTLGGSPTTALLAATSLTLGWTGQLAASRGGTGVSSLGNITRTNDTNVTLTLGGTPTGAVITSTSFTLGWTGTLAVARGGTGASTAADARTNLGLGNVDNTSDADKPVSTAQQTALDGKQPLDSDLTAIAALSTTAYGRAFLALADAAALNSVLGVPGTFTPSLLFGGAATGMTYSAQLGRHVRIGNIVFFQVRIILTAKGSSTGNASISGLPFTSAANPASTGICVANNMTTVAVPTWLIPAAGTSISLFDFTGSTSISLTDADFTNTSNILFSGFYTV